jgi:acetyl-CoA C-acetyltransferase
MTRSSKESGIARITGVGQMPSMPRYADLTYAELISRVAALAIEDAGLEPAAIDGVVLSSAPDLLLGFNEPQFLAALGLPEQAELLARVNTAAGSGLSAVRLALTHVAAGRCKRVLVVAADVGRQAKDHHKLIWTGLDALRERHVPMNGVSLFAFMSTLYMSMFKTSERDLALVTLKNRANGALNPFAQLRSSISIEEILSSTVVAWPIRAAQIGPAGGGAAAVVVEARAARRGGRDVAMLGAGSCAAPYSIGNRVAREAPTFAYAAEMTAAARSAYAMAGIDDPARSIAAAEIYASYPIGEIIGIEALGLCERGSAPQKMQEGRFAREGSVPVNLSGGATCGNPLSSTALLRVVEMVRQLRGEAAGAAGNPPSTGVVNGFGGVSQLHEVIVLGRA